MTPTKWLMGQMLVVFAIVMLGVWAATEWAAAMLGYQPELGALWLTSSVAWFPTRAIPPSRPWEGARAISISPTCGWGQG